MQKENQKLFKNLVEPVIEALELIFIEKKYADKVIEKTLKKNAKWGSRDRKFIAETTYSIVRWYRFYKEAANLKEPINNAFAWHLFAVHCIANNTELPHWEEFNTINTKETKENIERIKLNRKIRESIPDWLDELGEKELKERWPNELEALNAEAKVVIRVNTLKISKKELQEKLLLYSIKTTDIEGYPDALILEKRQNIFGLNEFKEGLFEIQDASSQKVAYSLNIKPGMRVIDACAGAGGKTLHIATILENKGKVVAMDVEEWKLNELKKRSRRAELHNIETKLIESTKTIKRYEASADRLLLDVPCSGLGVLKRNPDAKWKLSPEFVEEVKAKQSHILSTYWPMLKKEGLLVYVTCSILPSENQHQIKKFLAENSSFELIKEENIFPSEGFDGFYIATLKRIA